MKVLVGLLAIAAAGCVNVNTKPDLAGQTVPPAPPQLWSEHRVLPVSARECADKGLLALQSLSYSDTVRNGNYSYGNFASNRAAVKCVENGSGSFVYIMVAGPDRKTVEKLRNELVWKFN